MTTYYAVHKGRRPGIYKSWNDCKKQIDKFEGAIFKKFTDETDAKEFLKVGFGEGKKPRSVVRKENDDIKNKAKIDDALDDALDNALDDALDDPLDQTDPSYETNKSNALLIYTDGSCTRINKNLTKAGYGIYIPEKNIKVGAPLLNQKLTNNRAEMTAIIESIKYLDEDELVKKKICIFTDSQYSMYIFNGTGERYEKDGYKKDGKDVPNIDLIKKMLEIKRAHNIVLLKIRAHTDKKDKHSIGNDIADKLAGNGANQINHCDNIFACLSKDVSVDESIDKNIQMNELFEFDEKEGEIIISKKKTKNPKLSNWFIKI